MLGLKNQSSRPFFVPNECWLSETSSATTKSLFPPAIYISRGSELPSAFSSLDKESRGKSLLITHWFSKSGCHNPYLPLKLGLLLLQSMPPEISQLSRVRKGLDLARKHLLPSTLFRLDSLYDQQVNDSWPLSLCIRMLLLLRRPVLVKKKPSIFTRSNPVSFSDSALSNNRLRTRSSKPDCCHFPSHSCAVDRGAHRGPVGASIQRAPVIKTHKIVFMTFFGERSFLPNLLGGAFGNWCLIRAHWGLLSPWNPFIVNLLNGQLL